MIQFISIFKYPCSCLALFTLITFTPLSALSQAHLDPIVKEMMSEGDLHSVCIRVAHLDVISTPSHLPKLEKGISVYNKLKLLEAKRGMKTKQYLDNQNQTYRSFLIAPVIISTVSNEDINVLLSFEEVVAISHNENYMMASYLSHDNVVETRDPEDPEWGIQKIEADSVWNLGYRGQNAVVAGQDTGYEWEHQSLKAQYAGWNQETDIVNHNYRWHDAIHEISPLHNDSIVEASNNPCGLSVNFPCDDHNHGTHTMGTMVGSDSLYQIGVAPEAKWIACRSMERGYGTLETYLECFEWFLAPTRIDGTAPKPWLAPDVINNSWACPEMEGCNSANFSILDQAVQNLTQAGIAVVASAGNSGDDCSTIITPAAIFDMSFTVGATNAVDTLADFSSRGPIIVDSTFNMKPNVTAPGVDVRSSIRNGEYRVFSGTSMAGPHVAGAIALIISANPSLKGQVETIFDILQSTAKPLTLDDHCEEDQVPNNLYGHGRINVLKAVEMALVISDVDEEVIEDSELTIIPNPIGDQITLEHYYPTLLISSTQGQLVGSYTYVNAVSVSHLPTGSYVLTTVDSNAIVRSGKFIKL